MLFFLEPVTMLPYTAKGVLKWDDIKDIAAQEIILDDLLAQCHHRVLARERGRQKGQRRFDHRRRGVMGLLTRG